MQSIKKGLYMTAISAEDVRAWYRQCKARGPNQHVTTVTLGKQTYFFRKKILAEFKSTLFWNVAQHMPKKITPDNVRCDRNRVLWTKEHGLAKRALAMVIACGGYYLE